MPDNVSGLPNRGKTYLSGSGRSLPATYGQSTMLEGYTQEFKDVDSTSTNPKTLRSNKMTACMLVRNASGIALAAKRVVKWKSGKRNKQVDGYCAVDHEAVAGVVDEHLGSSGAPDDDLFWIAVLGPSLILTSYAADATNVIALDAILTALTAATSQAVSAGRVRALAAATTNTTNAFSIAVNKLGRAMSAKTTANTNTNLLVDLEILSQA